MYQIQKLEKYFLKMKAHEAYVLVTEGRQSLPKDEIHEVYLPDSETRCITK